MIVVRFGKRERLDPLVQSHGTSIRVHAVTRNNRFDEERLLPQRASRVYTG